MLAQVYHVDETELETVKEQYELERTLRLQAMQRSAKQDQKDAWKQEVNALRCKKGTFPRTMTALYDLMEKAIAQGHNPSEEALYIPSHVLAAACGLGPATVRKHTTFATQCNLIDKLTPYNPTIQHHDTYIRLRPLFFTPSAWDISGDAIELPVEPLFQCKEPVVEVKAKTDVVALEPEITQPVELPVEPLFQLSVLNAFTPPPCHVLDYLVALQHEQTSHIVMGRPGEKKYRTKQQAYTATDVQAHLRGDITIGIALLPHEPAETRYLAFDVDSAEQWELLQSYGPLLLAAGYKPIYEHSATDGKNKGGGRLWVFFNRPVDLYSAREHIYGIVPELRTIDKMEQWPGPNNVRLIGGKYTYMQEPQWNWYSAGKGGEVIAFTGEELANVLLDYLTDGSVIPLVDRPVIAEAPIHVERKLSNTVLPQEAYLAELNKPIDPRSTYPIDLPPALQRAWFNAHNSVEDIAEREANGFVLATWRGERTASVVLKPATNSWVDMGAGGEKDNGKRDSGDALKLASLVTGRSQAELLYEARQEMLRDPEIIEKRSHRLRRMRITEPLAPPIKERITEPLPTPAEMGATFERVAPTAENGAAPNEGATAPCTDPGTTFEEVVPNSVGGSVPSDGTVVPHPCKDEEVPLSALQRYQEAQAADALLVPTRERITLLRSRYENAYRQLAKAGRITQHRTPPGLREPCTSQQFETVEQYLTIIGNYCTYGNVSKRAILLEEMNKRLDEVEQMNRDPWMQPPPKQGKQKKKGAK